MAEYSKPYTILFRGVPLAQVSSVNVSYMSDDKPVKTLLLGLAGFSDGAHECRVEGRSALPLSGFERDFAAFAMAHQTVEFSIKEANKVTTLRGRFIDIRSSSSVDSPNEIDFTFHGALVSRTSV